MCEYCEEHKPLLFEKYKFEASIWNGEIQTMDRSGGRFTFWLIPIRCCPMCGRDLMGGHVDELEAALRRACEFAAKVSGSCPLDMFDYQTNDCEFACEDQYAECWRRYFERGDEE